MVSRNSKDTEAQKFLGAQELGEPGSTETETWDEEREGRENWTGRLDFMISCIGYAVGLGNVWRFPYLCYNSGGGAFLIPYLIFMVLCAVPLVTLEICLGQFASLSPTALFQKLCPLLRGVGWGMVIVSGVVCVYYNIIITWTIYYLYLSFRSVLPWSTCEGWWTTERCVVGMKDLNDTDYFLNVTLSNETRRTASEEFWIRNVLQITERIEDVGGIRPELLCSLIAAWCLIFACLFKGVKSSGWVVYVTATFPYLVLVTLLIRGVTLDGAWTGISFYLIPKWHRLWDMEVWLSAASQIFYSVGPSWGALITMSSYNKFRHNCFRDALVIPMINCGTSIFAGIVVFSIIGFMAHESGRDIEKVIESGPGLAFIVYPEALANLPLSPVWAVLFFVMLLMLGVDTQFGMFETLISALIDTWPKVLRPHKTKFTAAVCFGMFIFGIPFVTQGGMYLFQLMDWYCATFTLMFVGMSECLIVSHTYGFRRFQQDIAMMIDRKPSAIWFVLWGGVTPFVICSLLISSLVNHSPVTYQGYTFPTWSIVMGWSIAVASVLPVPVIAIMTLYQGKGTLMERLIDGLRPTPDWGPSQLRDRIAYRKSFFQVPSPQLYVAGVDQPPISTSSFNGLLPISANALQEKAEMDSQPLKEAEAPSNRC